MTLEEQALSRPLTRAERVRSRRARMGGIVEPLPFPRRRSAGRRRLARRQYNFTLSASTSAAVSLPAWRPGARLLSFFGLAVMLWIVYYCLSASKFRVTQIGVEGASLLSEAQIRSIAKVAGQPIFAVDPAEVERKLVGHSEIETAKVELQWPRRVLIQVQERRPSVVWNDGGRLWWISDDGIASYAREEMPGLVQVKSESPVLHITQDAQEVAMRPEVVRAALALAQALGGNTMLLYDPMHGLGIQDPGGWLVYFGIDGDMSQKVVLYRAVSSRLTAGRVSASVVSVEHAGAVYYR